MHVSKPANDSGTDTVAEAQAGTDRLLVSRTLDGDRPSVGLSDARDATTAKVSRHTTADGRHRFEVDERELVVVDDRDFMHIDPTQRAIAKRRYQAVMHHLGRTERQHGELAATARLAGQDISSFHAMVARWRRHRDPAALLRTPSKGSERTYGRDERAVDITRNVIREIGGSVEDGRVVVEATRRCVDAGVKPLSGTTIWTYLRGMRSTGEVVAAGPPRIVIGRLRFEMPLISADANVRPTMLVAVLLPERRIIAHDVCVTEDAVPSMHRLLHDLCNLADSDAEPRSLIMHVQDHRPNRETLAALGLGSVVPVIASVQRDLARAFGDRLGMLRILYRTQSVRTCGTPQSMFVRPLTSEQALAAIEEAIALHHAGLDKAAAATSGTSFFRDSPTASSVGAHDRHDPAVGTPGFFIV